MEPPLCTNGSAGYLMQLSVKLALNNLRVASYELIDASASCEL